MVELTLRERKYAATKAALMQAVITRLDKQSLDEIAVKDVCNEVQVSETTFFNYFPTKRDVIIYFVQLWSIAVAWEMGQTLARGGTQLDAIRSMFSLTAEKENETPGLMSEIVAFQAQARQPMKFSPLTPAEYAHHFPDSPGAEQIKGRGIVPLVQEQLIAAQQVGELPPDADVEALGITLMSIFFITPVLGHLGVTDDIKAAYHRQIDQLLTR